MWLVFMVASSSDGHTWPCSARIKAYKDALAWMPSIVRRLQRVYGPSPRIYLCQKGDWVPATHQERVQFFQQKANETAQRLYQQGDFRAFLRFMLESARVILAMYDPSTYIEASPYTPVFHQYVHLRVDEIPRVFYGYPDELLTQGLWDRWVSRAETYARSWNKGLSVPPAWGLPHRPEAWLKMDYRSPAFAMASLCLQRAETDMVRYWLYVWKQGHGSMRGLPVPFRRGIFVMRTRVPREFGGR